MIPGLVSNTVVVAHLRWGEIVHVCIGALIFIFAIAGLTALVIYGLRAKPPLNAESQRFKIAKTPRPLPACRFRPYSNDDFDACSEIYLLNEPRRFPKGNYGEFCKWLREGSCSVFVLEIDGKVDGFGGISVNPGTTNYAWLSYGMIHPAKHRKGYGTALLLARISLLPDPESDWVTSMNVVEKSAGFYKRFGFDGGFAFDEYRHLMGSFWAVINADGLKEVRGALDLAGIEVRAPRLIVPAASKKSQSDTHVDEPSSE